MQNLEFKVWDYDTSKIYTVTKIFLNEGDKPYCEVVDTQGTKLNCFNFKLLPFTGLVDINSTKIYLGDIIAVYEENYTTNEEAELIYVGEVIWDEAECCFSLKGHEPNTLGGYPVLRKVCSIFEIEEIPVSEELVADKLQYVLLLPGSSLFLYEEGNNEPIEEHSLNEYLGYETNLEEIETAFLKEIQLYSRIIVELTTLSGKQIFEFSKSEELWKSIITEWI